MIRMMRGRWFWGVVGALATAYFLRRPRGNQAGIRSMTSADAYRMGRTALDNVYRAGRSVAQNTARAVSRRN